MPRISRHGEGGTREMALPPSSFQRILAGAEPGKTVMAGRSYDPEHFPFVLNASAVRTPLGRWVWSSAKSAGIPLAPGHVSIVFLAVGLGLVASLLWGTASNDLLHGQIALTVVLLCAPATWAMSVVWMLPTVVVLLATWKDGNRIARIGWFVCAAGLLLAGVPDQWLLAATASIESRYILALTLCLAGLIALARSSRMKP
jgi:hypothetical protein